MQSLDSTLNDIDENERRTPKLEFSDDDGSDDDLIVSNSHVANRHHDVSESKVSIIIPRVVTQPPSLGDRIIGFIMSGGRDFQSGLTGQPLLYFTSVFVSLGVFLFGYDQGVMSGIITSKYFLDFFDNPSRFEIGSMVAILEIGALISSLLVGRLGDAIGRRKTILYGALIFVVGGAAQSLTTGLISMIIGRTISGFGGPIKDAARVQERKKTLVEPSLTPQQLQRLAEYEMQKQLQQEYTAVQVVDESQRIQGEAVPLNAGAPDANKSSNKVKIVKTPGGNLRYHHVKKNGTRPKCADTGVPLPGVAALRPREYANISKTKKTVSRAYGGSVSANAVKEKIIRAFLVEEQKVVKRVLKESAEKAKSEEKPKKKSSKK
ncbi:hypothetical protein DV495_004040 [Geotrichum candidum]|nr:hypothetical protein DV495_004040 [Geotrichum candidum]KAI9213546.1 hypothetical protein DS838_001569 [Geotrichum bryndzae]